MKKKIVSLLLAGAMVASLTACGNSGSGGQASGGKDGGAKGGNELTVWCWDPAFNIYSMNEAAKVYQKDHPDFKLNVVETPWADIQTKLTTAATSGKLDTLPDIILLQDNAFQKNVLTYPDAFKDITASGIDFTQFAKAKTAYSVVNGKNYGDPLITEPLLPATEPIFWNRPVIR